MLSLLQPPLAVQGREGQLQRPVRQRRRANEECRQGRTSNPASDQPLRHETQAGDRGALRHRDVAHLRTGQVEGTSKEGHGYLDQGF